MTHVIKKMIDNIGNANVNYEDSKKEELINEDNNDQKQYFEFVNNLGCNMSICIEDYLDLKMNRFDSLNRHDVNESHAVIEIKSGSAPVKYSKDWLISVAQKLGVMKKKVTTKYDRLILRMDVCIEDMEGVRAVPIEFAGVRSYKVNPVDDSYNKNLSFVVNVGSKSNGQITRVSFESPVLISNNCDFPMTLICSNKLEEDKSEDNEIKLDPNGVFIVPFTWILNDLSILYKCEQDGEVMFETLVKNITSSLLVHDSKSKSKFRSEYLVYK